MTSSALPVDSIDLHGNIIAVGLSALEGDTWDGGVQIRSAETGEILAGEKCETGISMVRFAGGHDGSLISCACDDGSIRFYSSQTLDLRETINGHDDIVSVVKPTVLNNHLLSASWDSTIKEWDLNHLMNSSTHTPVFQLSNAHYGAINDIAVSESQPALFASAGSDGFLRLWDRRQSASHGCVALYGHEQAVSCVEFNALVDNIIYSGTDAGEIFTFDLRNSKDDYKEHKSSVHEGRVRRIRCVPSRREHIVSCSDDATIMISVMSIGENDIDDKREVIARFQQHEDYVTDIAIVSCDAENLAIISSSTDRTVRMSDFKWNN